MEVRAAPVSAGPTHGRLEATRRLAVLDEMRVPYHVREDDSPWQRIGVPDGGPALHWYVAPGGVLDAPHRLGPMPMCVAVAPEPAVADLRSRLGSEWHEEQPIATADGRQIGAIWRASDRSTIVPFDPDGVMESVRSERYRETDRGPVGALTPAARRVYYGLRPLMPRRAQIAMRRLFTRLQSRRAFPRWPAEPSLHDFSEQLLQWVADAAGEPVPCIAAWPDGHGWALVMTHDVEHAAGRDAIERVRAVERAHDVRSSWNLVPERYEVADALVARLRADHCEVGVHGLRHDGRDFASPATLRRRLPEIRRWADRWGAVGFRAPAMHRHWTWMPALGFDYDSSYPDTDPYEPMPGGCCFWLPFFNRGMVELPVTLPQDHTVLTILRQRGSILETKTDLLRTRGGMALLIVHPDYMLEDDALALYDGFLARYADDPRVWRARPQDVSDWWRQRAASTLVRVDGRWEVRGPGADRARIAWAVPTASDRPIDQLDHAA